MKPKILIELQYLPPVPVFIKLAESAAIVLEACEHYQKGGYRNRCVIAGPNGPMRLTIPLLSGKNQQQPIQEVRLSYRENWPRQHWQSIQTAYGNAPFFIHYADALQEVYAGQYEGLWSFNLALFKTVIDLLGWRKGLPVAFTDVYHIAAPEGWMDYRGLITPRNPPPPTKPYLQVFTEKHGFLPNLSILDLLFCAGPEAGSYLAAHAPQTDEP